MSHFSPDMHDLWVRFEDRKSADRPYTTRMYGYLPRKEFAPDRYYVVKIGTAIIRFRNKKKGRYKLYIWNGELLNQVQEIATLRSKWSFYFD